MSAPLACATLNHQLHCRVFRHVLGVGTVLHRRARVAGSVPGVHSSQHSQFCAAKSAFCRHGVSGSLHDSKQFSGSSCGRFSGLVTLFRGNQHLRS